MSLKDRFDAIKISYGSVPLALLVVCVLSFGLFIPDLGYYWDDWETALVLQQYDLAEFWDYFNFGGAGTRPLAAWTYIVFAPLLGVNPTAWHVFTLLARWAAVASMWGVFSSVWPRHRRAVTYAAFLFAVYPVFLQQPIAMSYHQHWVGFALFFLSLMAMIAAVRRPRFAWLFVVLGVAGEFLHLAILEYFVGVELLRPVILWLVIAGDEKEGSWRQRLWKVVRHWLPYLLVLVGFTAWRVWLSQTHPEGANRPELLFSLFSEPGRTLVYLAQIVMQDLDFILLSSWYPAYEPATIDLSRPFILVSWMAAVLGALGLGVYLMKLVPDEEKPGKVSNYWPLGLLLVGLLSVLLGSAPIWVTERQAILGYYSNRFAMVSMFGASMMLVAGVVWLLREQRRTILVVSVLVGLGIGLHVRNTDSYRWSWTKQSRVYWQFIWRAPAIEPQTNILSYNELFAHVRPTFSLNMLYKQPRDTRQLAYSFYLLNRDFAENPSFWLEGGQLSGSHREFTYEASALDSLVLYTDSQYTNCMWMVRAEDADDPYLPEMIKEALPIVNLERISAEPFEWDYPATAVFGKEPRHDWCYYFQKGDLYRQTADWGKIVALGDEAREKGFWPGDSAANSPREWVAFIEAYGYEGAWDDAAQLVVESFESDPNYRQVLCATWQRLEGETVVSDEREAAAREVYLNLGCDS